MATASAEGLVRPAIRNDDPAQGDPTGPTYTGTPQEHRRVLALALAGAAHVARAHAPAPGTDRPTQARLDAALDQVRDGLAKLAHAAGLVGDGSGA